MMLLRNIDRGPAKKYLEVRLHQGIGAAGTVRKKAQAVATLSAWCAVSGTRSEIRELREPRATADTALAYHEPVRAARPVTKRPPQPTQGRVLDWTSAAKAPAELRGKARGSAVWLHEISDDQHRRAARQALPDGWAGNRLRLRPEDCWKISPLRDARDEARGYHVPRRTGRSAGTRRRGPASGANRDSRQAARLTFRLELQQIVLDFSREREIGNDGRIRHVKNVAVPKFISDFL